MQISKLKKHIMKKLKCLTPVFRHFRGGGLHSSTFFAPFDIVVQGHFQVISVIWAPYLLLFPPSGGAMAPSGLLLSSATVGILIHTHIQLNG